MSMEVKDEAGKKLDKVELETEAKPNIEYLEATDAQRIGMQLVAERQAHVATLQKLLDLRKEFAEHKSKAASAEAALHDQIFDLQVEVAQLQAGQRGDANLLLMEEQGLKNGDSIRKDFEGFEGKWMLKRGQELPAQPEPAGAPAAPSE